MARKVLSNLDLNNNQLLNALAHVIAGNPGSPLAGQFWYNSTTGLMMWRNASANIDPLARANHSGTQLASTVITYSGAEASFDTRVQTSRLDQMAVPTASVSFNSQKATNVLDPTAAQDAATKSYVDSKVTGLDWKASVRVATTATIAGATYNATGGTSARGQFTTMPNTIDGVSLAANDRVLVKDMTTGAQNGIYVVTTLGSGANGVWDRATDFDQDAEVTPNAAVFVEEGTVNADTGWTLTTSGAIIIGGASGTTLVWAQFTGIGALTAGAGLTKTGNTIDVIGGTGITVAADLVSIDTAVVVRKYASDIGDGSTTSIVVTHNLGTKDVQVTVWDNTTPFSEFTVEVQHTSTNTITLVFSVAPTTAQFRVVCHA